jgi:malate dehydrogenase (oxaloacetate-decarboxylating)(NADP+)
MYHFHVKRQLTHVVARGIKNAKVVQKRQSSNASSIDRSKYEFVEPVFTKRRGLGIVHDPWVNKGTGFDLSERDRLDIRGLVPPRTLPLETQIEKIWNAVNSHPTAIDKNMFFNGLQDRNETLMFAVLLAHIEELTPIVYTPTVGEVCKKFGSIFQRTRGMYFSSADRGHMATMVYNWPHDDVDVVCVTDGSRILGLGDLGANGMGISIGKLTLYVAAGGIHPRKVLPVMLDAGTDNKALREDPWYLGMTHPRLKGDEYFSLVHEFINAVHHRWPNCLIQFEDFSSDKASAILEAYRYDHLCFNDDISGTGSVVLAASLAAVRATGVAASKIGDQRIVILGAGSAGIGVAQALHDGMLSEGLSPQAAKERIWMVDKDGLLGASRIEGPGVFADALYFARHPDAMTPNDKSSLLEVIQRIIPTMLIGVTGVHGQFKEEHLRAMAKGVPRPIVFPLSNPTSHAECTAEEAYRWTDGRAIVATGSPTGPVEVNINGETVRRNPSQVNNMFIFPGVGLAATVVRAKRITDAMFYAASKALAEMVTEQDIKEGRILPRIRDIRECSARVAAAVATSAISDGIVQRMPPPGDLVEFMRKQMYIPKYVPIVNSIY